MTRRYSINMPQLTTSIVRKCDKKKLVRNNIWIHSKINSKPCGNRNRSCSPGFKIDFYLCTSASTLAETEDTFFHSK